MQTHLDFIHNVDRKIIKADDRFRRCGILWAKMARTVVSVSAPAIFPGEAPRRDSVACGRARGKMCLRSSCSPLDSHDYCMGILDVGFLGEASARSAGGLEVLDPNCPFDGVVLEVRPSVLQGAIRDASRLTGPQRISTLVY